MTERPAPPHAARPEIANDAAAPRALRVLIADDDRDLVLTLMLLLRSEGHEARGAYRGDAVLDMAASFEPDAALIDIGLPGMSGYDVARRLRDRFGPGRPLLVAITGWTKPADRILAELAGFHHHLSKPFEPQAVLKLLAPLRGAQPAR